MGPAYSSFQVLLYYPSLLLILYIYAVFGIPLRSRIFRRDYWFSIKTSFEISDIGHIFMSAMKNWRRKGRRR
uniref:Uncharacterized protein n=4 Tax=Diplazium TaxID=29614 RepID=A0A6B9M776_9MONI|nr:hypothetical protein Ycf94 [Diplazium virescens var. conterminum]QHB78322.1 hypothetical protein Ycf94 [Diplazium crassiusculum]QHB78719.1 hypothetical protein Ycf94 [Diplazium longisorum]QHB78754.1 hypothetical protein Ycf94 [Diplazium mettenianum]